MENFEKKKWLTKRKIIVGTVLLVTILIAIAVLIFIFINLTMGAERVYLRLDTRADFMVISREGSKECILITDENEISNFLKLHRWHCSHLICCWGGMEPEYTIKVIYGDRITTRIYFNSFWTAYNVSSTPYNRAFFNELQKYILKFNESENLSYQYAFHVRNSIDFHDLKNRIYNDSGNIAYLPGGSILATKPSITLRYVTVALNEREFNNARNRHQLGAFNHDDYFIPFIDDLKERGLFFANSTVSFSSSTGLNFSRRITIYLTRSLTESEITEIKNKSTETYVVGNPQGFGHVSNFRYNEVEKYVIKVIFDNEQSPDELKEFSKKYSIDNFDYDKELLEFGTAKISKKTENVGVEEYFDSIENREVNEALPPKIDLSHLSPMPFLGLKDVAPLFEGRYTIADWIKDIPTDDVRYRFNIESGTGRTRLRVFIDGGGASFYIEE